MVSLLNFTYLNVKLNAPYRLVEELTNKKLCLKDIMHQKYIKKYTNLLTFSGQKISVLGKNTETPESLCILSN